MFTVFIHPVMHTIRIIGFICIQTKVLLYYSKDNWTESEKFLQNANGPGNVWENNGPMVSDSIRRNAGLTEKYKYLIKKPTDEKDNKFCGDCVLCCCIAGTDLDIVPRRL